jgi:hypothetical protein
MLNADFTERYCLYQEAKKKPLMIGRAGTAARGANARHEPFT